jgi:surface antigen
MKNTVENLATLSRFALAAAIFYFAFQLYQINQNVPAISQSIDRVSQQVEPTLAEADSIREELAEIRKLIPSLLERVDNTVDVLDQTQRQIPQIVNATEKALVVINQTQQQIPQILITTENAVTAINETRQQIPQIVNTAENAIVALNQTRDEVLPYIPLTLEEIRLMRKSMQDSLDRIEILIEDANEKALDAIELAGDAGKKASEGAVSGFFTGLIKLPFELIGSLASPIVKSIDADVAKKLTDKDIELMATASNKAVEANKIDRTWKWNNPKSGNSGSLTIIRKYEIRSHACVEVHVRVSIKGKEKMNAPHNLCLNKDKKWVEAEELK